MFKFSGKRPGNLGVRDGKLAPSPNKPNCVNSQDSGAHGIAPLGYKGDGAAAMKKLAALVAALPNASIAEQRADYLYAEFSTPLMGFVDDVEFYLPPQGGVIHVRSASRLGYSDLGVNRKRIEQLRAAFAA